MKPEANNALDAPVDESVDPYSAAHIKDLSNGVLAELKRTVDAEIARRWEDCKELRAVAEPTPKRTRAKKEK